MFTVSLGNIPPYAHVVIKIVYVSELSLQDGNIVFCLPSMVAPCVKEDALDTVTQTTTATAEASTSGSPVDVQLSISMPINISSLHSPSHQRIRFKKTDTKATVELQAAVGFSRDFLLLVRLEDPYQPRFSMQVQEHIDKGMRTRKYAAMLSFCPAFDYVETPSQEYIILVDCSGSMSGTSMQDAQRLLHLLVNGLPAEVLGNIVTFGSQFDTLYPQSRVLSGEIKCEVSNFLFGQSAN